MIAYNNLSSYLRKKYGEPVGKICIDGGFSCPNRDGTKSVGGCIFCGERGAGEHIDPLTSIRSQVESFLSRQHKADKYIAYFQNFTNTYAPVHVLKQRYDEALIDPRIVILDVGTRPDCINIQNVNLLADYNRRYEVWVELGLQTANDTTAQCINRGYNRNAFERAVELLHDAGIQTVVHLIAGLPGETHKDVQETVSYLNNFPIWGIKLHCLYVMQGTELERLYRLGRFVPQSMDDYVQDAVYVLTHINPHVIIHRLTGDCPPNLLVAPEWNKMKNDILRSINESMQQNNLKQGVYFKLTKEV